MAWLQGWAASRFVRYLAAGSIAAGMNYLSRFAWSMVLPFWAAVLAAYVTGMAVAFCLFRAFVFVGSPLPLDRQIRNFALVNAIGASLTTLTAIVLADWLLPMLGFHDAQAFSHAVAVATPVASSWILHRALTFPKYVSRRPAP